VYENDLWVKDASKHRVKKVSLHKARPVIECPCHGLAINLAVDLIPEGLERKAEELGLIADFLAARTQRQPNARSYPTRYRCFSRTGQAIQAENHGF
jgi:hypothetical protein